MAVPNACAKRVLCYECGTIYRAKNEIALRREQLNHIEETGHKTIITVNDAR